MVYDGDGLPKFADHFQVLPPPLQSIANALAVLKPDSAVQQACAVPFL